LAWALLEHLVLETRQLTDRVFEFSTLCVQNRVQAELLRIAKEALESCSENQVEICSAPSDSEIASRTSTHREAVNREIGRLSKQSVLERHGRTILIKDMAALEEMVHTAIGD
jgi:CRP-like cAMP-binding protein